MHPPSVVLELFHHEIFWDVQEWYMQLALRAYDTDELRDATARFIGLAAVPEYEQNADELRRLYREVHQLIEEANDMEQHD